MNTAVIINNREFYIVKAYPIPEGVNSLNYIGGYLHDYDWYERSISIDWHGWSSEFFVFPTSCYSKKEFFETYPEYFI